jgi:hypothetical protein
LFSLKPEDQADQIEQEIRAIRAQISQWWQKCFCGEGERKLFCPYYDGIIFSNASNENLLIGFLS